MKDERVAREYAEALFDAAISNNALEKVAKEVELVGELLTDPEFEGYFQSVKVGGEQKKSVFNKVFLHEVSVMTRNFFWILFDNGRENLFLAIRNEFDNLLDEHQKRVMARVITAIPLSDDLRAKIQAKLEESTKREVILETVVDPTIHGGMMVYANGQIVDASVKSRLSDLRDKLIQAR
ncbi:MAG: ATP synthase F1 subunit delta [Actinomycetota bacterium]|nr:ATP synthase F1 subunit delta [Actinomycetota bacterium]